jgi:hypothetical protein
MKRSIILAIVAFGLATATGAFAKNVQATIKSIDTKAHSVTLDDGTTVKVPKGVKEDSLTVGEKVTISYMTDSAGKSVVSDIKKAK